MVVPLEHILGIGIKMFTLPIILSGLALIVSYAIFQFGLFKWLIGRIDLLGVNFKEELLRHQQNDIEALKEIRTELAIIRAPRKRAK